MDDNDKRELSRYSRTAAVLICGVLIGALATSSPVGAHFRDSINHIGKHMKGLFFTKSQSNQRFLRAASTLQPGTTMTGVYSAWGGGGYVADAVSFRIPLQKDLAAGSVHFIPVGGPTTSDCPGAGRAARGHLCVYEHGESNSTFTQIYRSGHLGGGAGSSKEGFGLYFTTGDTGWSFGEWTVTAPSSSAASTSSAKTEGATPP